MMRWLVGIAVLLTILAGLFLWKGDEALLAFIDWRTPKTTLADHQRFLADHVTVITPEKGEAPYPTVIQFHGCAGMRRAFHEEWARVANAAGYAAVLVDSNAARSIEYEEALATICEGEILLGQERAGDVLAAISLITEDPRIDTERLVLAGWSHGAWTVMDFLTMDMDRRQPANLKDKALPSPQIDGAILFYPHCGRGALAQLYPLQQRVETLAFVAGKDRIVEPQPCIDLFTRQKEAGEPVDLVVYPEADHIFDDATLRDEFPEYYNEAAAADSATRYANFLENLR